MLLDGLMYLKPYWDILVYNEMGNNHATPFKFCLSELLQHNQTKPYYIIL